MCVGWAAPRGSLVSDVYLWPKKYFIIIIRRYVAAVDSAILSLSLFLSRTHTHTHTHTLFFSLSLYLCLFRTIAVQMSSSRIQRIKENSASPVCSLDVVSFPRKDSKGQYVEEAIGSPDYQKVIRISIGIVDFFSGFYTGPSVHGVPPCAAGTGVGLHRRNRAAAVMHANEA